MDWSEKMIALNRAEEAARQKLFDDLQKSLSGQPFKLYVWEGIYTDYTSGMAIAVARSAEEAILAVVMAGGSEGDLRGMAPEIYDIDRPRAAWVFGGG